ncbi:hypothetical protein [Rhizorhabdus argentea]|uniref:hypothetical protein n=1 Tax=Rhizorhabdus argentea TaxID=1387174 RepID=UPI0030EDB514
MKLAYLAASAGFFCSRHRAAHDCRAAIELLAAPLPTSGVPAMRRLLEKARRPSWRIWAENSPFDLKGVETWSGSMTAALRGVNHSGGTVESAGMGISEKARKVLQAEDIRAIGDGRQILKVAAIPSLIVGERLPYFVVDPWKDQLKDVRKLHTGEVK